MLRYQIRYEGRVQGVGFRHCCRKIAMEIGLTGWAENQPDGSVIVVVEGERAETNQFVVRLFQTVNNDTLGQIDNFSIDDSTVDKPSGDTFEIRP